MATAECLILGLLSDGLRYGHEIDRMLDARNIRYWAPINRATIYQVLARLTSRGWVEARTEREGRMPERTVYSITPAGEEAFRGMVIEGLGDETPVSFHYNVPLAYLSAVPREEALAQMQRRRDFLVQMRDGAETSAKRPWPQLGARAIHRHMVEFYTMELRWLDWLMDELREPDGDNAPAPAEAASGSTGSDPAGA